MKKLDRTSLILHTFIGIGAMAGGSACLLNPMNPLGAPSEMLRNSPFTTFLIPGILLFSVIGLGNILCAFLVAKRWGYRGYASGIAGGALIIWIIVQCIMIQSIVFLHWLFFFLGIVQACLAFAQLFSMDQFPASFIKELLQTQKKKKETLGKKR
ncbi:hypothetical protein [uncultured Sphaerochaeta sp.]|uniref:hypothetical protein n=1 Tax=uncultured Sphaerochaeta sp. TaxID=886478 RepID=UPI002A0A5FD2|nr:hypothetical protein [uncultured Sphaerochaeta sp.]